MNGNPENQTCGDVLSVNPIIGTEKKCSKCGIPKSLDDFYGDERKRDGKMSSCKCCFCLTTNNYQKRKRENDPQVFHGWHRKYTDLHRGEINERVRGRYHGSIEQSRAKVRKQNYRVRATPMGRLNCNISNLIRDSLRSGKNRETWSNLVGYNITKLRAHLEKQFLPEMSWNNYGEWHVDHKIPVSAFNFETPNDIDFKKCWKLSNLQPLWAAHNLSKSDKVEKPIQPSLLLEDK